MRRTLDFTMIMIVILTVCLLVCGLCIFLGVKNKISSEKLLRECTSSADGVIEKVQTYHDSNDRPNEYEYKYTILFTTDDGRSGRFITRRTSLEHKKGENVKIHYAPDNFELMYADIAPPTNGITYFIMAGVVPFFGLATILVFKRRSRSLAAM